MSIYHKAPRALARAISLALTAAALPVDAVDYDWVGGQGDWDTASAWDPFGSPQSGDNVAIHSGGLVTYNTAAPLHLMSVTVDGPAELHVIGSALHADTLVAGATNCCGGEIHLSGGVLSGTDLHIGRDVGSDGTFLWDGGDLDVQRIGVGVGGSGRFIYDTDAWWALMPHQSLVIGAGAGSDGLFEHRSGTVYADTSIIVGDAGQGTYRHSAGMLQQGYGTETIIGSQSNGQGRYELSGATAHLNGSRTVVGDAGAGTFVHTDGNHDVAELIVGRAAGSDGEYQLSGGSLFAADIVLGDQAGSHGTFVKAGWPSSASLDFERLIVGRNGSGQFVLENGGSLLVQPHQSVVLGEQVGSEGVFEQRDSYVNANYYGYGDEGIIVGEAGRGIYRQYLGRHEARETLIGHQAGSEGSYELSGSVSDEWGGVREAEYIAQRTIVGDAGTGHFIQSAGLHSSDDLILGRSNGGSGEYQLSGGTLYAINLLLGEAGGSQGRFDLSGGNMNVMRLVLGEQAGSRGVFNQTDDGYLYTDELIVGRQGSGEFIYDAHQPLFDNPMMRLVIGEQAGSDGLFEQRSGHLSAWGGQPLIVGESGRGVYRQLGAAHHARSETIVGHLAGSDGTYEMSGSVDQGPGWIETPQYSAQRTVVGDAGTGRFLQQSGGNTSDELVMGRSASGVGEYQLSGDAQLMTIQTVVGANGQGRFIQTGGRHAAQDLVIGQAAGSHGEYELHGGRLETQTASIGAVAGANGTMKVVGPTAEWWNQGDVQVGADLFALPAPGTAVLELQDGARVRADTIIVRETGTLRGAGFVDGDLINNGDLAPGLGAGTIDIVGNYTQLGEGTLSIEIGGHNFGVDQDILYIFGDANLAGSLNVSLLGEYQFSLGESFDILYANMIYGGFDSLLFPIFDGMTFDIVYDMNAVRLSVVSAVPVPAAAWLFGSGFAILAGMARRRKAA